MSGTANAPERGDIAWLSFDPQAGHEQAGRRPALVISPSEYNRRTGMMLVCPITNKVKDYLFEVPIPDGAAVTGVVLADQLKSLDWRARNATRAGTLDEEFVLRVVALVLPLIDPDEAFGPSSPAE